MKLVMTLSVAAVLTFSLRAEEPRKSGEQPASAATTTVAPAPADGGDSPLVQAAKRSKRLGRKPANVITNESVKTSKGHITTTTVQRPVDIPEPEMSADDKARADRKKAEAEKTKTRAIGDDKQKKAASEKDARAAATATAAEDAGQYDAEDADPAASEHAADEEQKPPQR